MEKVPRSLNSLQSKADKLDVHKLKSIHVDLNKLSNVVDNVVNPLRATLNQTNNQ